MDVVWDWEEEEHIESIRRQHKTENDIRRAKGQLQEDEEHTCTKKDIKCSHK